MQNTDTPKKGIRAKVPLSVVAAFPRSSTTEGTGTFRYCSELTLSFDDRPVAEIVKVDFCVSVLTFH